MTLASRLPAFTWDRIAPLREKAGLHPDGLVDLSMGTPVDPVPDYEERGDGVISQQCPEDPFRVRTWGVVEAESDPPSACWAVAGEDQVMSASDWLSEAITRATVDRHNDASGNPSNFT